MTIAEQIFWYLPIWLEKEPREELDCVEFLGNRYRQ
jgi:hypothetical protein